MPKPIKNSEAPPKIMFSDCPIYRIAPASGGATQGLKMSEEMSPRRKTPNRFPPLIFWLNWLL